MNAEELKAELVEIGHAIDTVIDALDCGPGYHSAALGMVRDRVVVLTDKMDGLVLSRVRITTSGE